MSARTVTTQAELDAALADAASEILIDSPRGVWIKLEASGSATVEAYGSATVRASGSATVEAYDSATVRAYDSATVRAYDSATVRASRFVAVHLFSARATVSGGVAIDIASLDMSDPTTWLDYHGLTVADGKAIVYKAVSPELVAGQGRIPTTYTVGETVTANDWRSDANCGHGLHFGATPRSALSYYQGNEDRSKVRLLACEIGVAAAVPLDDKIKAKSCRVLHEVTIDGDEVSS